MKAFVIVMLTLGIYLYFGQYKNHNPYANRYSTLITHFIDDISLNTPLIPILKWFDVDPSHIEINKHETMIRYKLKILAKSLNNYFSSLSQNTTSTINKPTVARFITGQYYDGHKTYDLLKRYLKNNKDVLEISLFKPNGQKLSTVRYQNTPEYTLHPKLLKTLNHVDTTFVKSDHEGTLIHVSKIKHGNQVIGIVTQTISQSFFTKILDHLEISGRLFYLKNASEEVIVDNYDAYQIAHTKHKQSIPYLFYKHLTSLKTHSISLGIEQTKYTLGVIIEENNTFGNLMALLSLLLFLYLAMLLLSAAAAKSMAILKDIKQKRFYRSKRHQHQSNPTPPSHSLPLTHEEMPFPPTSSPDP